MLVTLTKPTEYVGLLTSSAGLGIEDLEPQRNCRAFHGNTSLLLVLPAVEVSDFPGHPERDDIVRGQKGVHKRCLPVVHMTNRGHIPDQRSVGRLLRYNCHRSLVVNLRKGRDEVQSLKFLTTSGDEDGRFGGT